VLVMPSNHSNAHKLDSMYPGGFIGQLIGPGGWRNPRGLPFACDNGRFSCWSKGKGWDEKAFWSLLVKAEPLSPLWVVVPDEVGDAVRTFDLWQEWSPKLDCFTRALAVQDGMTPASVRKHTDPAVIFVGGSTEWKRQTMWKWCHEFPRVHVGRINTEKWLWNCARCGAESCDGTGWFRGNKRQLAGLHRFLRRYVTSGTHPQKFLELEYARTFGDGVPSVSHVPYRLPRLKPRKPLPGQLELFKEPPPQ